MILNATLQQMAFLFSLIIIGYLLMKLKAIPQNSEVVLSKLENYLFIPALVLSTFIANFTIDKLASAGSLLLFSIGMELLVIPIALLSAKLITKDKYIRKIYLYGLSFSNFSFMGNAIVKALFPDIFLEYIIFTLALWTLIYLWGAPSLLIGAENGGGILSRLKNLLNPMFVCMILGIIIGLTGIKLPAFTTSLIDSVSACMSPVAMLITGMTIAKIDIKSVLKIKSIYVVTFLRLIVYPLIFIGVYYLFGLDMPRSFVVCVVVSLAMPLGLNTIVIPSAYGKDVTVASGMALVSHILSAATIPIIFSLMPF